MAGFFIMDLFCNFKKNFSEQIIYETNNFYLIHDAFPLLEGHLMIIPIKHLDCFLNLDKNFKAEFIHLKKQTINFLTEFYSAPKIFEHSILAQTIKHAHLHFLPTDISILKEIKQSCEIQVTPTVPYLYYSEIGKDYYFSAKSKIFPGFLHVNFAKKILKDASIEKRKRNGDKWMLTVKENWNKWQHEQKDLMQ